MSEIKSVVFDMDGVLIDAREWHYDALNQALAPFNFEISKKDHQKRFDGLPTSVKLNILSEEFGLPVRLHPIISAVKQDRTLRIAAQKCFPNLNLLILINRLKSKGYKVGVYTNSIKSTTLAMLTYSNLIDLFDCIVTNEDVDKPKPFPEGYLLICNKLGYKPKNTLVIEDGDYGVQAAKLAGCNILRVEGPNDVNLERVSKVIPRLLEEE